MNLILIVLPFLTSFLVCYFGSQLPVPLLPPPSLATPLNVVVLGGTGAVGTALVSSLISSPDIATVTLISRRAHPSIKHQKVTSQILQMASPESFKAELQSLPMNYDIAFNTMGVGAASKATKQVLNITDHLLPLEFCKAAVAGGTKHLSVMTAILANSNAMDSGEVTGGGSGSYNKVKGELEEAVKDLMKDVEGEGSLMIIQPSVILGTSHTPGFLAKLSFLNLLLPGWLRFSTVDDIAAGMRDTALRAVGAKENGVRVLEVQDYMAEAGRVV